MTQISTTGKSPKNSRTKTRIQKENETRILTAALDVFSENGFRGATLDRIASTADMSKPNLLYYFKSKEEIHVALLTDLLDVWLAPLREISPQGEPADEIGIVLRCRPDREQEMPRIAGGEPLIVDPVLKYGGFFIDKLFEFVLQEGTDMGCAGEHLIREQP